MDLLPAPSQSNEQDFLNALEIYANYYSHKSFDRHHEGAPVIHNLMEHLDKFYLLSKLKYGIEIINRSQFFNETADFLFLDEICGEILRNPNRTYPVLFQIYAQIIELFIGKAGSKDYFEVKQFFFEHTDTILRAESYLILKLLFNHLARQERKDKTSYYQESIILHDFGLNEKIYFINGSLLLSEFHNVFVEKIKLRRFEEAASFLENYLPELSNEHKENATFFYQAMLYFFQKDYDKAFSFFKDVAPSLALPFFSYLYRSLGVRLYFSLYLSGDASFFRLTEARIDSFLQFLRRAKSDNEVRKFQYSNFLKILKSILYKLQSKKITIDFINKTRLEIAETTILFSKNWLEEQLDHIEAYKL